MKQKTLFHTNLSTLRHSQKMTTAKFARTIGVDPKRLADVEKGRLHPSEQEIKAVLKKFKWISREQLLNKEFELVVILK